ncbi:MAG: histidinol dehydrogenase [Legionellales bacterium]|nr:histidinol dehydrogenase [Legionellales bacterium]
MFTIYFWSKLDTKTQQTLLQRPSQTPAWQQSMREQTQTIIDRVRMDQDTALFDFTQQFDQVQLTELTVSEKQWQEASQHVSSTAQKAIRFAYQRIYDWHAAQRSKPLQVTTYPGVTCEKHMRPIERVGLYVPGGSAPLVSTVLMLGIPAALAGCRLRVLCTPPNAQGSVDPHILFAAKLCQIHTIYQVGGAQAIAAMAYGTQTIPKVSKIFGPGNGWVTQAKLLVSQDAQGACLDLPAGPSEVLVIADEDANPAFVAADLLAQAEHGPDSQVILITTSQRLGEQVRQYLTEQLTQLSRQTILQQSLNHARLLRVDSLEQAITLSNQYAPEHLILNIKDADAWVSHITCAGSVFVGPWAAETLGDYTTGSNHVLPTEGYADRLSGLGLSDFQTALHIQKITQAGLLGIGETASQLAALEGLDAHQLAVNLRLAQAEQTS